MPFLPSALFSPLVLSWVLDFLLRIFSLLGARQPLHRMTELVIGEAEASQVQNGRAGTVVTVSQSQGF